LAWRPWRPWRAWREIFFFGVLLTLTACDSLPGRPDPAERYVRPSKVTDAAELYASNCAGCHGDGERPGAAVGLADPLYLAIADDTVMREAIAKGVKGTSMPAFSRRDGGSLTEEQIEAIVRGIRQRWDRPTTVAGEPLLPYAAPLGDAERGRAAFTTYCSSCHGADGRGGDKGGSVVDGSYLALVSDQGLRTTVLVGRPALGMPDWRNNVPGKPMSAAEVADVVAWLATQRQPLPGQPYASGVRREAPLSVAIARTEQRLAPLSRR
jgi:mono/diheme cytochrome c family protein